MVEVKESTYEEALLRQLHFILEIRSPLKTSQIYIVFFDIYTGSNI